ncbi:MAG: hypothetical protein AAGF71_12685, partial [Pseudomonadota bacterium]
VPLTWQPPLEGETNLAARGIYLFIVWAALVIAAAITSHRLERRFRLLDDDSPSKDTNGGDEDVF